MWLLSFGTFLLMFPLVHSLEVTPYSKCISLCANDISRSSNPGDPNASFTLGRDVVCEDYQLAGPNSTVHGRKWKDCLSCELTSTATDSASNENELYWVLFNMKFSFDWCVFAYPDNANQTAAYTQCANTCSGPNNDAKSALVDRLLQTNATIQYQYCQTSDGAFSKVADDCVKCLETVPESKALANYVIALNAACSQKPGLGKTLKLDFDLFPPASSPASTTSSAAVVTVTANPIYPPPAAVSAQSALVAAQASASASSAAVAKATQDKNRRLGLGAGVSIGAVGFILAIIGIIWGRRRAERNRMIAQEQARARWEAEYHARVGPLQYWPEFTNGVAAAELGEQPLVEADNGWPGGAELAGNRMSRSTSGTLRNSGIGTFPRGKQPPSVVAVPGK